MDIFAVCFVVDSEWHSGAWLFLAYFNGADSYTKLQLIVFVFLCYVVWKVILKKKYIAE